MTSFDEWEKTHGYGNVGDSSDSSGCDSDDEGQWVHYLYIFVITVNP
jgi:hypothetical protein